MKTLRDFDFTGKKVLLRMDTDVPLKDGAIVDDYRLRQALPTIKLLLMQCKQLIIIGHAGRPKGEVVPEFSLKPVAERLHKLLGDEVVFIEDFNVPDAPIVMLENLRFHQEEEMNEPMFARKLASLADVYVNEAFAVSHRTHASTVGVAQNLPGCVGLQLEKELHYLNLENMPQPVVALLGGAKLETKLPVIQSLIQKVRTVLLGGAMIFTFYKAKGWGVGKSLLDENYVATAESLLNEEKLVLPKDIVIAADKEANESKVVAADVIPEDQVGLDIGPETMTEFKSIMLKAKTIIWNGPLGYYESPEFAKATNGMAEFLAGMIGPVTIVGGGDTAAVVNNLGLTEKFTHVSTGGGASLKLLEGKTLPAIEALK